MSSSNNSATPYAIAAGNRNASADGATAPAASRPARTPRRRRQTAADMDDLAGLGDMVATAATVETFDIALPFNVSLDEEHVFIDIVRAAGRRAALGERVRHYNLLLLARARLDDANRGLDPDSQGWVDVERAEK